MITLYVSDVTCDKILSYCHHRLNHLCLFLCNNFHLLLSKPLEIMADPTKAETEQVFKVLKAQKANKVCTAPYTFTPECSEGDADVLRLSSKKSDVVECYIWCLHMSRLL